MYHLDVELAYVDFHSVFAFLVPLQVLEMAFAFLLPSLVVASLGKLSMQAAPTLVAASVGKLSMQACGCFLWMQAANFSVFEAVFLAVLPEFVRS